MNQRFPLVEYLVVTIRLFSYILSTVSLSHASCSAPAVPIDSTIQNLRLSYKDGDRMNVTCNVGSDWFDVSCDDGIWIGQNIVCPDPPKGMQNILFLKATRHKVMSCNKDVDVSWYRASFN